MVIGSGSTFRIKRGSFLFRLLAPVEVWLITSVFSSNIFLSELKSWMFPDQCLVFPGPEKTWKSLVLRQFNNSYGMNVNCPPQGHQFAHLVSSRCCCIGRWWNLSYRRIDFMEEAHYWGLALRFYGLVSFAVLLNVDAVWPPSSLPLVIMFIVIISLLPKIYCCVKLVFATDRNHYKNHRLLKCRTAETILNGHNFEITPTNT